MIDSARRGTKRGAMDVELEKEERNERSETGAFGAPKTSFALPK